jgi:intracellular sulfur oxidation DsrE/DsrF family protein
MMLRERVDGAASDGIEVSVCPRSVDAHGIRDEQVAAIGARPRPLADILVEVAEGRSVLVYL